MSMELEYIVQKNDKYTCIYEVLVQNFKLSTRLINKLIKNNKILLNNIPSHTKTSIYSGDKILVDLNLEEDNENVIPTKMNLKMIYEDDWFLVVDKPAGIPIHPSSLHYTDSLSNGVKYYFDSIGLKKKIRPVNRLDLNTSGLVIFAKCEFIQESFIRQMLKKDFKKIYLCVVNGVLENKKGTISAPITRKNNSIIERCVNNNGQTSITHYEVISEFENYSLVKCILETGRTHQIRVHMSYIGHSILGDTLYGKPSNLISRQALHSYEIELIHPVTNAPMYFVSELPDDIIFL